jgi:hypothetical protein
MPRDAMKPNFDLLKVKGKNTCTYLIRSCLGITNYLLNVTALHFSFDISQSEKEQKHSCVEFHN